MYNVITAAVPRSKSKSMRFSGSYSCACRDFPPHSLSLSLSHSTGFQCVVQFEHVCLGGHTHSEHGIICGIHAAIELVHHIEDNETNDQHQQRHKHVGQHQRRIWYGIQHCCNLDYYDRRYYDSFQTERVRATAGELWGSFCCFWVRRTELNIAYAN